MPINNGVQKALRQPEFFSYDVISNHHNTEAKDPH